MRRTFLPAPELPPGRPLLVVTGFMGTGKTTAGRMAARRLGLSFVDLDTVVASRAGTSVQAIFAEEGERGFRRRERRVLEEAARLSAAVVATGGGAPAERAAFEPLARDAVVAVLVCEPGELLGRLRDGAARPMLRPDPSRRIGELLREREEAYAAAGVPLETTGVPPEAVAEELADRYRGRTRPGPTPVAVGAPSHPYRVLVGDGALERVGEAADLVPGARTAAVLADRAVDGIADRVAALLGKAGLRAPIIGVPSGEDAKSIEVVSVLWSALRDAGVEPGDAVVAVGGGATLDAAGFAAATYVRGLALVTVPTTLLGMADAALGGKVGIDHAGAKNLVGAFHDPRLVVVDPTVLASLPPRLLRAGMAEVVKAAVLASPLVLDVLDAAPPDVGWLLEQAVRIKAAYVTADPRDRLLRHSLNLGHTFAHAVEAASGYAVPHGEAVAAGLVAAARLGTRLGLTEEGLADRIAGLLAGLGLPTAPPVGLDPAAMVDAMAADKKRRAGRAAFVVPAAGGAELVEGIPPQEALACLLPEEEGSR